MKKITLFILSSFFVISVSMAQNFSELSFTNIEGNMVSLSSYPGKKVLFFILPLNQSDSNFSQLQGFKNRYLDTVTIIGVLSFEDGFLSSNVSSIQVLYGGMGIVITEGMFTKKTSGTNQSQIMRWLTDKNFNVHFDMDSKGIGHKFFVNESGRLYAVMPPQTPLNSPVIDRIVHSTAQ